MNRKYTHIFFDLDNTLWDFEKNSKKAMEETFGSYELKKQTHFDLFFKIYKKNNIELWNKYRNKELGKKELIVKRFKNTFTETGISGIDPEEMNNHYLKVMPKQKVLIDGAIDILEYLKKKNYQLSIITNGFREVQTEKIISSGLYPYFFKIFVSEDVKTPKPGREIFEYAMKSSNAKKSKSIMIGDDWDVDIIGALNFGFDAIHYRINNQNHALKSIPNRKVEVFEINTLKQIENLL